MERFDTVVVGGGQAGIATSEHLGALGIDHVVLERHRIAERWRTERWDTLVANGRPGTTGSRTAPSIAIPTISPARTAWPITSPPMPRR